MIVYVVLSKDTSFVYCTTDKDKAEVIKNKRIEAEEIDVGRPSVYIVETVLNTASPADPSSPEHIKPKPKYRFKAELSEYTKISNDSVNSVNRYKIRLGNEFVITEHPNVSFAAESFADALSKISEDDITSLSKAKAVI